MDKAVERAIECIWERYSDPLSLTDIAKSALLSRFHFARVFRNAVGVTPGRYLAAVRIYHAKRLLLSTPMTITDIAFTVGYSSLGSFTNYFTQSVGLSPGRFRRIARDGVFELPQPHVTQVSARGALGGVITVPERYSDARVYVGIFSTPIVQHRPLAAALVDVAASQPCSYLLPDVPAGNWFVHAVAVADTIDPEPWTRRTLLVGGHHPVTVAAGIVTPASVRLRPSRPADPPILLAFPDFEPPGRAPSPRRHVPSRTGSQPPLLR
jgi:AraC family transcriptional regulator